MHDDSFDGLPQRFHECQQRLAAWWHLYPAPNKRIEELRGEMLHRIGQAWWCLFRLQQIERQDREPGTSSNSAGSLGQEMWVVTEAFYYAAHSFLKLCEKVPELGLDSLYEKRLRSCDVIKVRNHMIEHIENPAQGVVGATFGWGDDGLGPELKPFATSGSLPKARGLYVHTTELIDQLEKELAGLGA